MVSRRERKQADVRKALLRRRSMRYLPHRARVFRLMRRVYSRPLIMLVRPWCAL